MNKCRIHLYICLTHNVVAIFFCYGKTFIDHGFHLPKNFIIYFEQKTLIWQVSSYLLVTVILFPLSLLASFFSCGVYGTRFLLQTFFANLYLLINQQMITNGYELKVRQIRVFITGNKTPTLVDEEK